MDLRRDTLSAPSEPLMNALTTVEHAGFAMNFETSRLLLLMSYGVLPVLVLVPVSS